MLVGSDSMANESYAQLHSATTTTTTTTTTNITTLISNKSFEPFITLYEDNDHRLSGMGAVLGGAQAVITLLLNFFLFIFIVSRKKLRKKNSHRFYLNLQIVNIIVSVSGIAGVVYLRTNIEMVVNNALIMATFVALVLTTVDRYIAIMFPFTYERLTASCVYAIIILSWLPSICFVVIGTLFGLWCREVVSAIMFGLAAIILTSTNIKVYAIAREHSRRVNRNQDRVILKSTYVCGCIVLAFVLTWFPFFIHNILAITGVYTPDSHKAFTVVSVQIGLFYALLEPILFVLFHRDAKRELMNSLDLNDRWWFRENVRLGSATQPLQSTTLGSISKGLDTGGDM